MQEEDVKFLIVKTFNNLMGRVFQRLDKLENQIEQIKLINEGLYDSTNFHEKIQEIEEMLKSITNEQLNLSNNQQTQQQLFRLSNMNAQKYLESLRKMNAHHFRDQDYNSIQRQQIVVPELQNNSEISTQLYSNIIVNDEINNQQIVFITNSGMKFHKSHCACLQYSKFPIRLSEARRRGLTQCAACNR